LIPYDLVLEEGISRLYRAELTVLTDVCHTQKQLAGDLLDRGISMSISQPLQDGKTTRTRYLHGIITGVKSNGILETGMNPFYSHVFTIEPALARLRFTRSARPFYEKTPLEIIEEILKEHQLLSSQKLPSTYLPSADYGSYSVFNQHGSSDLNFLQYILSLYGLSFTFQHKRFSASLVEPELFFSGGRTFPVSDIVYSDNRLIPARLQFMYHAEDEERSLWKMDRWSVAETIGVDGLELTAPYPKANYGSSLWSRGQPGRGKRSFNYASMFHGYQRDTDNDDINTDVSFILDASYRALHLAKSSWTGTAANLTLQPGCIFELRDFYGAKNNTSLTAIVTDLHLHCRTWLPDNITSSPDEGGELTEARVWCADYDDETGCNNNGWRFCKDPR
jgi:uncharacterized protein involved in type VI secretion and phage assembly